MKPKLHDHLTTPLNSHAITSIFLHIPEKKYFFLVEGRVSFQTCGRTMGFSFHYHSMQFSSF